MDCCPLVFNISLEGQQLSSVVALAPSCFGARALKSEQLAPWEPPKRTRELFFPDEQHYRHRQPTTTTNQQRNSNNNNNTCRYNLPACHSTCIPTPSIPALFVFERAPFWGGFFLFAGAEGLKQAGKPKRAGNPSGAGAHISLPAIGISADPARRGGGERGRAGGKDGERRG